MTLPNVVAFLASDDANYMTGQSINIDGGVEWHLARPTAKSLRLVGGASAGASPLHFGVIGERRSHDVPLGGHVAGVVAGVVESEGAAAIDLEPAGTLVRELYGIGGFFVRGSGASFLLDVLGLGQLVAESIDILLSEATIG